MSDSMDMLLTERGFKESVDAVMERIGEVVPDADKNTVGLHVSQVGAAVVFHTRFRIREVDGRIGAEAVLNFKGKITGQGFVDFQW